MKTITLVTPHYAPESGAAAKRLTAIAEFLVSKGWQVTVLTLLPNYPENKIYAGFDVPVPDRREEKGVTIIRLRPWFVPRDNLPLRLMAETLFSMQTFYRLLTLKSEVILASSPFMFLGPSSLLASRLKRTPFCWDVRDLTWLYVGAAGKKTYGLDKILVSLMRWSAKKADALTAASEGFLNYFVARPQKTMTLFNGVTEQQLELLAKVRANPLEQGLKNVVFAGLIGYNQYLSVLIETAKLLPEMNFTICGDGPDLLNLKQLVQTYQLTNVRFTGYLKMGALLKEYEQADILVAHVRSSPVIEWLHPAKLWEYMATGKPVVHAGEGDIINLIRQHAIAVPVPPENPQAFADAISYLASHPEEARAMGERGRHFVENERNREKMLANLEQLLTSLLKHPS
jgi:colanic acid biosynthesis glycosyl transferase WcaI